ncbi:MAG TPA: glycosyltransferase family 2 protein [Thermoanaerobaculia bacterium]|nr:glycosyltransferase family 2 protein [Thermoanaerobaculia bacterium]
MRLAIVLVHYHTPGLAALALEALWADVQGLAGMAVDWLLVDNGSDAEERDRLAALPARRIDPGGNLGYAGGVNRGVAETDAGLIVVMNPDVIVLPGCVPALIDRLRTAEDARAVAGPACYWDHGRRLLLPPAEKRSRREEVSTLLACRGEARGARARRRWRRHARRHWEACSPLPSHALSGSLLALTRPAWEAVGPFDEGFRLFFEETDWLLRAGRRGVPSWYVPAAGAVHLYNQSAGREPRAQAWFEESARRFRRLHYGEGFAAAVETLDRRLPPPALPALSPIPPAGLDLAGLPFPLWVEVSPNPAGFPAAAELLRESPAGPWRLPEEVEDRLPAGTVLTVQAVDAAGRELRRGRWARGTGGGG